MRLPLNLAVAFLIWILALIVPIAADQGLFNDTDERVWLPLSISCVMSAGSLYFLQNRFYHRSAFEWFFWVGILCFAVGLRATWSEWTHSQFPSSDEPSPWLLMRQMLFSIIPVIAGLIFTCIALIQDQLRFGLRSK